MKEDHPRWLQPGKRLYAEAEATGEPQAKPEPRRPTVIEHAARE